MSKIAAILCLLVACGTTDESLNDGPLVQVAESTSSSGAFDVAVFAHTTMLTRGNYMLEYVFTSSSDGSPIDGLELTIVPWMPAMGHGTSITPTVTALGSGAYELDDIDLYMAGLWQLRTTTTADQPDAVEPALQVQ